MPCSPPALCHHLNGSHTKRSPPLPLITGPTLPTDVEYMLDLSNSLLLILFALFLGLGAGPLLPRYLDELLPPCIKGRAMAAGTTAGWVASLAVGASLLPTIAGPVDIGGVYLIYGEHDHAAGVGWQCILCVLLKAKSNCCLATCQAHSCHLYQLTCRSLLLPVSLYPDAMHLVTKVFLVFTHAATPSLQACLL